MSPTNTEEVRNNLTLPMPEGMGFFLQPPDAIEANRLPLLEVWCPEALRSGVPEPVPPARRYG